MNHLKWMGHASTVFEIQRNLRNDPKSCEVTLVAQNGSVRAHRFVLSSCSDLLRSLLHDVPMDQEATIVVPDIRGSLLDSVLAFIYMGETNITSTNLSEFLEAINILGIKSAISFECNTTTMPGINNEITANSAIEGTSAQTMLTMPHRPISGIQIGHEELLEEDNNTNTQKIETHNTISEQQGRDLEFLDVYNETQHKITYSIEHMPGTSNPNEFILTENVGTFTLTENPKLDGAVATTASGKIDETEDDNDNDNDHDESNIIEEYSSGTEPIIEIGEHEVNENISTTETTSTPMVIRVKSKVKAVKMNVSNTAEKQHQPTMVTTTAAAGDPISVLNTSVENYSASFNDSSGETHLDMAVRAVINEGISLQKAAQKYEVSKTVLWRRVRKQPNYMKTTRENPLLILAYERLKTGESLKNISRALDIPMSTLHRHKVRLAHQGCLPDHVILRKRDSVSRKELATRLSKAVYSCVHDGMSQNHAANLYRIPKSTLWRHLQKRVAEAELAHRVETEEIKEEIILS